MTIRNNEPIPVRAVTTSPRQHGYSPEMLERSPGPLLEVGVLWRGACDADDFHSYSFTLTQTRITVRRGPFGSESRMLPPVPRTRKSPTLWSTLPKKANYGDVERSQCRVRRILTFILNKSWAPRMWDSTNLDEPLSSSQALPVKVEARSQNRDLGHPPLHQTGAVFFALPFKNITFTRRT